jgi:MFS family permease
VSLFCSILGLVSSFAPEFWSMIVLRMLVGFGIGGSPVAFSLFSEFLPTPSRGRFLVIFEMFWVVGTLTESGLAWVVLPTIGWRWLFFISALPFVFLLGLYPWIPESPRLLLAQGKVHEAQQILERVASWNKSPLPPGRLVLNTANASEIAAPSRQTSVLDLFSPNLRRLTIVLWAIWFAHSIVYYGLILFTPEYFQQIVEANKEALANSTMPVAAPSLSVPIDSPIIFESPTNGTSTAPIMDSDISTIDPQVYLLTFITTLGEFPGLVASGVLVETRLGRKWLQTIFLFLSGVSLCGLFANPSPWVAIFLMLGGRLFVNGSWAAAWACILSSASFPYHLTSVKL